MRFVAILIICLWINVASVQSEEIIQQPVPPVAPIGEKPAKSNNEQNAPNNITLPSKVPVVINSAYALTEEREINSGNNQGQSNEKPDRRIDWVAVFTGLLAFVTAGLVCLGYRQERSLRTIERAYVKMSHKTPPGLQINSAKGECSLVIQVKNWGRTPAEATSILISHDVLSLHENLPQVPDYKKRGRLEPVRAFLVTEDEFFLPWMFTISTASAPSVCNGTERLYVFGYVDYIDKFRKRHRGGYARRYDPNTGNLVFVTQPGYNYDRPRKKGEGND